MNAVFATDADLLVDDYRAFFILGDRFHRANRRARGELAVHTTVACPERREPLEHRRLDSYPVCAGERIEAGAVVIVPVLTCLDTVTAADAFGRIEEDASRLAIAEPRGRNQAAVLSGKALSRSFQCIVHAPMYHFFFAAVNYWRACEVTEGALENVEYGTRVEQKCVATKSVRRKNTSDSTCQGMCCVHPRQAESVDVSLRENYRGSGLSVSAKSALASLVEDTSWAPVLSSMSLARLVHSELSQ